MSFLMLDFMAGFHSVYSTHFRFSCDCTYFKRLEFIEEIVGWFGICTRPYMSEFAIII